VSATYWVLVSDALADGLEPGRLPEGLVLAEGICPEPGYLGTEPVAHWHRFTDAGAPPELEGKRVELILSLPGREGARPVITERRVTG
jgi:hypothetical protein